MEIGVIVENLLRPAILFFVVGFLSILVKSDLEIPPILTKACAIFLLLSIGLEGGMDMVDALAVEPDLLLAMITLMFFAMIVAVITAIGSANVFKAIVGFKTADAWATAGLFAAVSTATFVVAIDMAEGFQAATPDVLVYGGWMVAVNVFLDAPGIIAAIVLGRMALIREGSADKAIKIDKMELLHGGIFGWAIWLMLTGLIVGVIAQIYSPGEMEDTMWLFDDAFDGVLLIFLLEMGMSSAKRIDEVKAYGTKLITALIMAGILPLIWGIVGVFTVYVVNLMFPGMLGWGDALVFGAMAGSASFISGPPALRASLPEANPSVYLPMSLALTFPFNIIVGLPVLAIMSKMLWGV